jgi:hypothetical protein
MSNFLRTSLYSMDSCSPADMCNMVWALATLHITPPQPWQAALQDRLQWQVRGRGACCQLRAGQGHKPAGRCF